MKSYIVTISIFNHEEDFIKAYDFYIMAENGNEAIAKWQNLYSCALKLDENDNVVYKATELREGTCMGVY